MISRLHKYILMKINSLYTCVFECSFMQKANKTRTGTQISGVIKENVFKSIFNNTSFIYEAFFTLEQIVKIEKYVYRPIPN